MKVRCAAAALASPSPSVAAPLIPRAAAVRTDPARGVIRSVAACTTHDIVIPSWSEAVDLTLVDWLGYRGEYSRFSTALLQSLVQYGGIHPQPTGFKLDAHTTLQDSNHNAYSEPLCSRIEPQWRPQTPPAQRATSPTSACSEATIRPRQFEPPAYTDAPYLDSPPLPYHDSSPTSASQIAPATYQEPLTFHIYSPTSDIPRSNRSSYSDDTDNEDDENVPLAQLVLCSRDAPPAYSSVVRQSYRDTLLQHIPRHAEIVDLDEEAALERIHADDVRFTIERVAAMATVMALLFLIGMWVGLVFIRR